MEPKYKDVKAMALDLGLDEEHAKLLKQRYEANSIARDLKAVRAKNLLSQEELAEKLGVSQSWVAKVESTPDNKMKDEKVDKYLSAFNMYAKRETKFYSFPDKEGDSLKTY